MPRNAVTNDFLIFLYKSMSVIDHNGFWLGLHDRREEGSFEWVDGSPLGKYSSWGPGQPNNGLGQPNNYEGNEDCVLYSASLYDKDKWADRSCDRPFRFICQAVLGRP
ncbi:alpha-N-acetylgalactosamine-specific lectin-like [Branchiostoma floridae]|uniref:Alpha-N-acetylgalactosamine-specific lectin-like n=1 Tax=Branchiostoma floridae TaxID=7739 RepID=A0A9J7HRY7_BRAFL|nr:alpha-N-acetylgalactosamine-specific lectin-like [Branchiostoma floridae]